MCNFCKEYEDTTKIGCELTILDDMGGATTLSKYENLYYDHELSQMANWFKLLLHAVGYEFIDEVNIISYKTDGEMNKFSSEDC